MIKLILSLFFFCLITFGICTFIQSINKENAYTYLKIFGKGATILILTSFIVFLFVTLF